MCSLTANRARHRGYQMFLPQLPEDLCLSLSYSLSEGEPRFSAFSTPMRKELYLEVSVVDSVCGREAEASRMK